MTDQKPVPSHRTAAPPAQPAGDRVITHAGNSGEQKISYPEAEAAEAAAKAAAEQAVKAPDTAAEGQDTAAGGGAGTRRGGRFLG